MKRRDAEVIGQRRQGMQRCFGMIEARLEIMLGPLASRHAERLGIGGNQRLVVFGTLVDEQHASLPARH